MFKPNFTVCNPIKNKVRITYKLAKRLVETKDEQNSGIFLGIYGVLFLENCAINSDCNLIFLHTAVNSCLPKRTTNPFMANIAHLTTANVDMVRLTRHYSYSFC